MGDHDSARPAASWRGGVDARADPLSGLRGSGTDRRMRGRGETRACTIATGCAAGVRVELFAGHLRRRGSAAPPDRVDRTAPGRLQRPRPPERAVHEAGPGAAWLACRPL